MVVLEKDNKLTNTHIIKTMNRFFKNIKLIISCTVMAAMVGSLSVSCSYDDEALWKEIENIKGELAQLRASIESELASLHALIDGQITIKSVEQQKEDGSKVITLSDGTKITVYPESDKVPADIITIVEINGVKYWAMYDGIGNAQPIVVNGEHVPVADVAPQTRVNGDAIEISFDGGETWVATGYNQSAADRVIADIKVVYSDWQTDAEGNPVALYCELTLVDGSVVKIGMQNGKLVLPFDSVFVANETTTPFAIEVADAADFMTTTPKGWVCDVEHNAKEGRMILNFTAPSAQAISAGSAVGDGVAKLMVVFNNGSSAIASIKLSTKPATTYFTAKGAYIKAGYGANYLLCGMVAASEYNADAVARDCNAQLAAPSSTIDGVVQLAFTESMTTFVSYEDLVKGQLKAGVEYVFWCVAPRENEAGEQSVKSNELSTQNKKHSSVSFKVNEQSFFDVNIKFEVVGSEPYALGYVLASEFNADEIIARYNAAPSSLNAKHKDMSYEGSFVELFADSNAKLDSGARYVAWYLAKTESGEYVADNLLHWEFSTMGFDTTGDIEVVAGEATCDYDFIEVELDTDKPHMMIYYNAMPSYMASAYPDAEYIIEMLIAEGTKAVTDGAVVARYSKCKPGEKITFFAVAVDKAGKIGKPFKAEYTSKTIEYNSLELKLELVDYTAVNTMIKVTCDGAKSYKYIYAPTGSTEWTDVYGGSTSKAGEYIIKNPNNSRVHDTADKDDALVDGHILIDDLVADKEYAVIVMAVDEAGLCSKPKSVYFTPIMNVGEFVYKTDAGWERGKPEIVECYTVDLGMFDITWYVRPQKGYTAYTLAEHPLNFENGEYNTPEKVVAYILANVDKGGLNPQGNTCEYVEGDNYSRTFMAQEDLNGDGMFTGDELAIEKTIDGLPGVYNFHQGTKDATLIFTTWQDQYGNFHEPFVYDPTNEVYVEWDYENYCIKK